MIESSTSGEASGSAQFDVTAVRQGRAERLTDRLAEESPVALVYNDEPYVVMMATPRDLEDFALGFSLTEGLIGDASEMLELRVTPLGEDADNGYQVDMRIPDTRWQALSERRRNLSGRSGCGLCGAQSISTAIRHPRRVSAGLQITEQALYHALGSIRQLQEINAITGAIHAAAWARKTGEIVALREDVGRHNALDKLIGALVVRGEDFTEGFVLVTSRASYEMVLKSAVMGIALMMAISAPTAFAIRLAEEAGMTLIGFARENRYVIYSCPRRIQGLEVAQEPMH